MSDRLGPLALTRVKGLRCKSRDRWADREADDFGRTQQPPIISSTSALETILPDIGRHRQIEISQFRATRCLWKPERVNSAIWMGADTVKHIAEIFRDVSLQDKTTGAHAESLDMGPILVQFFRINYSIEIALQFYS